VGSDNEGNDVLSILGLESPFYRLRLSTFNHDGAAGGQCSHGAQSRQPWSKKHTDYSKCDGDFQKRSSFFVLDDDSPDIAFVNQGFHFID
jgi:hypothetical protein